MTIRQFLVKKFIITMPSNFFAFDIELFRNYFLVCFISFDKSKKFHFEVSNFRDDREKLFQFLEYDLKLIGYNSLHYDSQIIEYILRNKEFTLSELYNHGQDVIQAEWPEIKEWKLTHKHFDIFKMQHYDRKKVSLKWCQFGMDWHNVEDLPFPFYYEPKIEDVPEIISYCYNDTESTLELFKILEGEILLRKNISSLYGFKNLYNKNNTSIGKDIALDIYCKENNHNKRIISKQRTFRDTVLLKDVVDERVNFQTSSLKDFLTNVRKSGLDLLNSKLSFRVKTLTCAHDMLKGGLHSVNDSNIFKSSDTHKIIDVDWGSYYPNLMLILKIFPEHLGQDFLKALSVLTNQRLKAKADKKKGIDVETNSIIDSALKISINSIFGCLNEANSFLYDPLAFYKVTINGQLLLLMLIELLELVGTRCVYANTDGATFEVPIDKLDQFYKTADEFKKKYFDAPLEYAEFEFAAIRDVNNFIAKYTNGEVKTKGIFENSKKKHIFEKNFSMGIVQDALVNYYIDGKPIEETVTECEDIFKFCIGVKAGTSPKKGKAIFKELYVEDGKVIEKELSKTLRYFISNKGNIVKKFYSDNSTSYLDAHPMQGKFFKQTVFNKIFGSLNAKDYDIDYNYYIYNIKKIINSFSQPNLLF